jgi:hypothetical protein
LLTVIYFSYFLLVPVSRRLWDKNI